MSDKIIFFKSNEFNDLLLKSYCSSFNKVFLKNYNSIFFKKKYSGNYKGFSYHTFLVDDNNNVCAACTIMPSIYKIDQKDIYVGTLVDVFIKPEKRNDPLLLLKLYNKIIDNVNLQSLQLIIAVPNSNAYNYWIKVVKFKKLGNLNYYILPILSNKLRFFGVLSSFIFLKITSVLNFFFIRPKIRPIKKKACKKYLRNRFLENVHKKIIINNEKIFFRIMNEKNFKIAYVFNLGKNVKFNFNRSISKISRIRDIDFITFIGNLPIRQFSLIKLPEKIQPVQLPLCIKLIDKSISEESIEQLSDIDNWEFSLYNFDVR
tara:strand:- start:1028 stop:1978 length:951 start_codon:yes stop_codon:yes gene_type:complete